MNKSHVNDALLKSNEKEEHEEVVFSCMLNARNKQEREPFLFLEENMFSHIELFRSLKVLNEIDLSVGEKFDEIQKIIPKSDISLLIRSKRDFMEEKRLVLQSSIGWLRTVRKKEAKSLLNPFNFSKSSEISCFSFLVSTISLCPVIPMVIIFYSLMFYFLYCSVCGLDYLDFIIYLTSPAISFGNK